MNTDAPMEQASLYALGLLSEEEAREFSERLKTDAELRAYLRAFEETAALLAYTVPQHAAPSHLKSKILSAIAEEKKIIHFPGDTEVTSPRTRTATSILAFVTPWALAACLAVFCGFQAFWNHNIKNENIALHTREITLETRLAKRELACVELNKQLATAAAEAQLTNIKIETLTSQINSSYIAAIAWDEKSQQGIMHVRKLPNAQAGKDYQLWVIDPNDPLPISAGVFTVATDGSAQIKFSPIRPVGQAKTFAVSLEKSGGSVTTPQGPIFLVN